ncbi:MAG: SGNH/GDSL hydrolase family protein [Phycisphaerales bacterium]|nr:SGNH/GDSL hydrolase family protein [Phycisphaerales bacterium]
MNRADIPFTVAVVGPVEPLTGARTTSYQLPELLREYRPDVVHVSHGHIDITRQVEADGNTYTSEHMPEIEMHLHHIIDAVAELPACECVLASTPPVIDSCQDTVRMDDVERLNTVIRSVGDQRDTLVDRLDLAIATSPLPPTDIDVTPARHLSDDGLQLTDAGQMAASRSTVKAIADVLLRAEHPWRKMLKLGQGKPFDGVARPRDPELD